MNLKRAHLLASTIHQATVHKRQDNEFCVVLLVGTQLITLDDEGVKVFASSEGLLRDMPEEEFTLGVRMFCEHCPKPVKCSVCGNP